MTTWFKHESAFVDDGAQIGEGSKIWHFCHVSPGARIGKRCALGQNVFVAGTAVVGDGVRIQNNVSIYDGVVIEDDAFIGPSAVFTNVINPRSEVSRKHEYMRTHVGKGATIGANATISSTIADSARHVSEATRFATVRSARHESRIDRSQVAVCGVACRYRRSCA
jgi:UDP-2-acetamido-3-amino-2,3-dideoxy-glucuronate N-acetyltransferase